jgi:hypothetical protein
MADVKAGKNPREQETLQGILDHFIGNGTGAISTISENEYKKVQQSMAKAAKDYELMMEIHKELKNSFKKLVKS